MKEAVEKIIKSLAAHPDQVAVTETSDGKNFRIEVRAADEDFGRIIGREGRTVKAIRSLLYYAGQKQGKRFHLDLVEE